MLCSRVLDHHTSYLMYDVWWSRCIAFLLTSDTGDAGTSPHVARRFFQWYSMTNIAIYIINYIYIYICAECKGQTMRITFFKCELIHLLAGVYIYSTMLPLIVTKWIFSYIVAVSYFPWLWILHCSIWAMMCMKLLYLKVCFLNKTSFCFIFLLVTSIHLNYKFIPLISINWSHSRYHHYYNSRLYILYKGLQQWYFVPFLLYCTFATRGNFFICGNYFMYSNVYIKILIYKDIINPLYFFGNWYEETN